MSENLTRFSELLATHGVGEALRFLNARSGHRYTGVFRFEPPLLRSLALVDAEHPGAPLWPDTLLTDAYCAVMQRQNAPLDVPDSLLEPRFADIQGRAAVRSYCGVLIRDAAGAPVASLCHFDPRPRDVPARDVELLERAGQLLAARLLSDD